MGNAQLPAKGCCASSAQGEDGLEGPGDEWKPAGGGANDNLEDGQGLANPSVQAPAAAPVKYAGLAGGRTVHNGNGVTQGISFTMKLMKSHPSESLGLDLLHSNDGRILVVEKILPVGLVTRWNTTTHASQRLQEGDQIHAVNQVELDNARMVTELREKSEFEIRIVRKTA